VFPKLSEFVIQMRQTGPIKKMLVKLVERMNAEIFKNPENEIKLGF